MIPGVQGDSQVYLNGDFLRIDEARISVLDRGFIFGDGIYEVVPVYRGKAFRMAEHLNRSGPQPGGAAHRPASRPGRLGPADQ